MPPDHGGLRRARATFFEALDSEFRELASTVGMQVHDGQSSALAERGLVIASTASLGEREEGGQNVALLHISTPDDLPLQTSEGAEVPPGNYVMHVRDDGFLVLRDADGRAVAETAIPEAAPDQRPEVGNFTCHGPQGLQLRLQRLGGRCAFC